MSSNSLKPDLSAAVHRHLDQRGLPTQSTFLSVQQPTKQTRLEYQPFNIKHKSPRTQGINNHYGLLRTSNGTIPIFLL
ncbi:hypothetical protein DID88_004222 [Monilinia fructigena]|uniref:Uncharacterized protein n=1 Tax=Monilinia fructigena TaxID=38457 RepID=A0A395IS50_9HELO|nr:hypothetical protein DID88_004222 [Monilinia fructigena]